MNDGAFTIMFQGYFKHRMKKKKQQKGGRGIINMQ